MKAKEIRVERVSAEGIILALETLMTASMRMSDSKGKPLQQEGVLELTPSGEVVVENVAAVAFALVHPWIQIHTGAGVCNNGYKAHEAEYVDMLDTTKKLLQIREAMVDVRDVRGEEENDLEEI